MITDIPAYGFQYIMQTPTGGSIPDDFSENTARDVLRFHRQLPGYQPTQLVCLHTLARAWGVSEILVKDESTRLGLGAFKVLGGSYAIARLLCQSLGIDRADMDFDYLVSHAVRQRLGRITFATATDGNHGRGVAWAAEQLGQQAMIYMPRGSASSRVENIRSHGAIVEVTDLNYDDAVRLCWGKARENGWQVIQDTVWEGYDDIPRWIMQGYMTLCAEAMQQMTKKEIARPTHVFVQAGVGSFAGAMVGYLARLFQDNPPRFIVMEPNNAAGIFASVAAGDGLPHVVTGDLATIMAGLACGEPNPFAWNILRDHASCYIRCEDFVAANGIRILANPLQNDEAVEAGESGSVGMGLLDLLANTPDFDALKQALKIGPDARLLLFNTEGATDPQTYYDILWHGRYPGV